MADKTATASEGNQVLTDEQIAAEEAFLADIPKFNWGAFLMPGIWGPAHGFWACILFYPLYLFIDNLFYGAYCQPSVLSITLAVIAAVLLFALCIGFSRVSQPVAYHKAVERGSGPQEYIARQRIWTIICVVLAIAALAVATYYNLAIRPGL